MRTKRLITPLGATLLVLLAGAVRAGEDCFEFSAYANCPPQGATCLLGPDPDSCAQDCSTCTPDFDDDGDCVVDEETLNYRDDDDDGLIDEDISCLNSCGPMGYQCPTGNFDRNDLDVPPPLVAPIRLPAKVNHWQCGGADGLLDVDVELAPDPVEPEIACFNAQAVIRILDRSSGTVLFEGPASLVHTRRWESLASSLVNGASGNVQVFRWLIRSDLKRVVPYAQLPPALQVPCNQDQQARPHLFFYGNLDIARDASDPQNRSLYRTAVVLAHTPGRLTHTEASLSPSQGFCGFADITKRPINRGDALAHDDRGWFVVAPGDTFTFTSNAPVLTGNRSYGRIRQVPSGGQTCPKETRMCESQFIDPGPTPFCSDREVHRQVRFCGQDDGASPCPNFNNSSHTKCGTVPNDRFAFFPVGTWSQSEFPAGMSVSMAEGSLVCTGNFEPYWYGIYTNLPSSGLWLGPPDALDVVDNQIVQQTGAGNWLLGSVNWINEGTPNEIFRASQFRMMYFFSNSNPDIPLLAPCQARAMIQPAPIGLCRGQDLNLSGAGSTIQNCCQCGGLEYRWSRFDGSQWAVMQDWSTTSDYGESPGPQSDTEYKLEVRCSTSRIACVDEVTVTVTVHESFTADAGPDVEICAGATTQLTATASGGSGPHTCQWSPPAGLQDPSACSTAATPAGTAGYTVQVTDAAGACAASDDVMVTVNPLPQANAGGPGPLDAPVTIGSAPCDPGLEYLWTPSAGLTPPDACDPLAEPTADTNYCLITRDRVTGCESPSDCVLVRPHACDAASVPGAISRLLSVKAAGNVEMTWNQEPLASGGYHVYRTTAKQDIPTSKTLGSLVVTTLPASSNNSGDDLGAVPASAGMRLFYQTVGVCSDGISEGPL